jgi:hypothetical protein
MLPTDLFSYRPMERLRVGRKEGRKKEGRKKRTMYDSKYIRVHHGE